MHRPRNAERKKGRRTEVLAIIPARGGSERIKDKNLCLVGGKPLIAYTIAAAKGVRSIGRVIVTTDDARIKRVSLALGAEVVDRPKRISGDHAPTMDAIRHVLATLAPSYVPDVVVLLQPTSPFRTCGDIDATVRLVLDGADSAETFCAVREHPAYTFTIDNEGNAAPTDPRNVMKRSQDLPTLYRENGAVYAATRRVIERGTLYGKRHKAHLMPAERSFDIDDELDLRIVGCLLRERR